MEQQIASYIKRHIIQMTVVVLIVLLLLAMGQYYLYRQQMHLNEMVSEGLMQIKEAKIDETKPDDGMIYEEEQAVPPAGEEENLY